MHVLVRITTCVCCCGYETHNLVNARCKVKIPFFNLNIDIMPCFVCLLIVLDLGLRAFECLEIL